MTGDDMNEQNMKNLVEEISRLVLAELQKQTNAAQADEGKDHYLVVGDITAVPELLSRGAVLHALQEYETNGNILCYQKVLITKLTLVQLADIAQGRNADAGSCAVVHALLNGIDVVMPETALPHRQFAGKGSKGLYALLENYVQTLQTFGVKLLGSEKLVEPKVVPIKPPKYQAPVPEPVQGTARPNSRQLITEPEAQVLAANAKESVCIPENAILTPSARDVFARARLEIRHCGG